MGGNRGRKAESCCCIAPAGAGGRWSGEPSVLVNLCSLELLPWCASSQFETVWKRIRNHEQEAMFQAEVDVPGEQALEGAVVR